MQIGDLDVHVRQEVAEVFGHFFGQRGHQRPFAALHAATHLQKQILDLILHRPHLYLRIEQTGGADDLFHNYRRAF